MNRVWIKRFLWVVLLLMSGTAVYQYGTVWFEYSLLYGPEQTLEQVISSDGTEMATFSVKYEGLYRWWPANPKPHFYITVTDIETGQVRLRETDFNWPKEKLYYSTSDSFSNLARVYAPWAVPRFRSSHPDPAFSHP